MSKENIQQKMLYERLWKIFNFFRGSLLTESVVSLFLQLLFYKFLEDNRKDLRIGQNSVRLNFPDEYRLANLMLTDIEDSLPKVLSKAFLKIENLNDPLLLGIFTQSDLGHFNRKYDHQAGKGLLELMSFINTLNTTSNQDGVAFPELFTGIIDKAAENELRRSGDFLVPKNLRELLAGLNNIYTELDETVYDPACGSGALLMEVVQQSQALSKKLTAFAQERNMTALTRAKMQWIINGQDPGNIAAGDALNHPQLIEQGHLQQFDKVISCPPFGLSGWGAERAASDRYHRFEWGIPPASRADYAYILHAIASLKPKGSAFLVCIAGVLFRGGTEEQIRKKMVDSGMLSAIVALPAGLFNLWNVPLCILCLNKAEKQQQGLLMVDLSNYPNPLRNKEGMNTATVNQVVESVKRFFNHKEVATQHNAFSKIITREEIAANDYNLNITRYFTPGDKSPAINRKELSKEISQIENKLIELDEKIGELKKQLKLY